MNGKERCFSVLAGGTPDRVPVVPQAFLFACESSGFKIGRINRSGRLMSESHRICHEKYGYDGCVIDMDDATLAEACGAKVIYRDDEVAVVDDAEPAIRNFRELLDRELPDPKKDGRLPVWLEATERLVSAIGKEVFIMGRADQGPFSLLCLLRGTQDFMMEFMAEDEDVMNAALEWCRKAVARFAKAQKEAGAHATSIGEGLAGPNLISPDAYRKYAFGPQQRLASELRGYGIPFSLHICGNTTKIIADMVRVGTDILEIDWQLLMKDAVRAAKGNVVLMGNVDPSDPLVTGTPEMVDAKCREIIEATGGRRLFLSSGCAMGRNTKPENFRAMISAAKRYGTF